MIKIITKSLYFLFLSLFVNNLYSQDTKWKEFFKKDDMKKIYYSEMKTKNPVTQESFVSKFLQSMRQKMYGKRKF